MDQVHTYAATVAQALEVPDAYFFGFADKTYTLFEPLLTPFQAYVNKTFPKVSEFAYDYAEKNAFHSPPLPFQDPIYVPFVLLAYFVGLAFSFVVGKLLGKRKLKPLVVLHNTCLFLLSIYMLFGLVAGRIESHHALINQPPVANTPAEWRLCKAFWIVYISKIYEFGDTFLMMLTQSYRQVTFLHVYHHASLFTVGFVITLVSPNGDPTLPAAINCFIHVIMYGYYAGTALFPDPKNPIRRFLNSIKFMITKGQLLQFLVCCIYSCVLYSGIIPPKVPDFLHRTNFYYQMTMLVLFGNFLIVNQGKTATGRRSDKKLKE